MTVEEIKEMLRPLVGDHFEESGPKFVPGESEISLSQPTFDSDEMPGISLLFQLL
jgi:hypothetical protein